MSWDLLWYVQTLHFSDRLFCVFKGIRFRLLPFTTSSLRTYSSAVARNNHIALRSEFLLHSNGMLANKQTVTSDLCRTFHDY